MYDLLVPSPLLLLDSDVILVLVFLAVPTMNTSLAVGSVYAIASVFGIALNVIAVWSIITHRKLKQQFSPLYILYLQPIITDIIFGLIYLCYLAPTIIVQANLVAHPFGHYLSEVVDLVQNYCWFNNSLSQVSLAVNRFVAIVLLRSNWFTRSRSLIISLLQHLLALLLAAALQFILPCCRIEFSYSSFGYSEIVLPGVPNYSFAYVNMPVKIGCSALPFLIYCSIAVSALAMGSRFKLQSQKEQARRKLELRFAAQFAAISLVYVFASFSFTIVKQSIVLPAGSSQWTKAISVVLALLNSTSNAVFYLVNERKKSEKHIDTLPLPRWKLALNVLKMKTKLTNDE